MNVTAEARPANQSGTAAPPFPGLRPFSSRDHAFFFGREDQTFALYRLLRGNHFVAVVGSSGSGKSSIVRAGLLPLLDQENEQSEKKVWRYATMRPGRDPINRLANALAKIPGEQGDAFYEARRDRIAAMLLASSHGISEAVVHTGTAASTQLVLVVDQFEELFRFSSTGSQILDRPELARRREEATNFIQLLLTATRSYDSQIRVVITMRSDFIGECSRFHGLPEAVSAAQFLVPSLTRDQREEAIRRPVELSGATISSELVERLLNDSSDELDQLPVLQHCLARLWMRAGAAAATVAPPDPGDESANPVRHLTEQHYSDIGGLSGALSGHADELFASLPGEEKTIEQIFRSLAEIDNEGRAVRRARPLGQLVAETGANREQVCSVLDKFRADDCSFLVPPLSLSSSSALPDETVIDVGHEALLRRWARVCGDPEATGERADKRNIGWLRQEQKDGERYQFLRSCVDPESLNESRLSDEQTRRYWGWWNDWKPNAAWAARYGGKFKEVEQLITDSNVGRRRARWLKNTVYAVTGAALVLLFAQSFYVRQQREIAEQQQEQARKQQQLAENTFEVVTRSTQKLSRAVLDAFNAGQTSLESATAFRTIAAELYDKFDDLPNTAEVAALKTSWLLTSSDLNLALGDKDAARRNAADGAENARRYLEREPDNRSWQRLLYGSLFRIGDLDLDESALRDNNGAIVGRRQESLDRALREYQESQDIADRLLAYDVEHPQGPHPADIDYLARQRFELAFAINKTGEALQVRKDLPGAIARFREALEYARMIENASRMEWKLQSAATRIKIARALRDSGDFDGAIQTYTEAIGREETLFARQRTDKIIRSNLASAYENRASLLQEHKDYDAAFRGYDDSARLYALLSADDPRDTTWLENLARIRLKYGVALEESAGSQRERLDRAAEQFGAEIELRERLVQRRPEDTVLKDRLRQSQERLRRVQPAPADKPAPGKPATAQ